MIIHVISLSRSLDSFEMTILGREEFHLIRQSFGYTDEMAMESLCTKPVRQIEVGGKSGANFYSTHDGKFLLKTLRSDEPVWLMEVLNEYSTYCCSRPSTMLPRYCACIILKSSSISFPTTALVVMNNVFDTDYKIHAKFDLKGSVHTRHVSEEERKKLIETGETTVVMKDEDFRLTKQALRLKTETMMDLMFQIMKDVEFLQTNHFMDYSLVVGIHRGYKNHTSESKEKETKITAKRPNLYQGLTGDIYFIGIIDILQRYTAGKKIETALKSISFRGEGISCVEPWTYGQRFLSYLSKAVTDSVDAETFSS